MRKLVDEGLCSMESISASRMLAQELDRDENLEMIALAEHRLKAVADRTRIKIMLLLSGGEMCVCQLTAVTDMPQPTISNALRQMETAGIIRKAKRGRWHFYSLSENRHTGLLLELVKDVA